MATRVPSSAAPARAPTAASGRCLPPPAQLRWGVRTGHGSGHGLAPLQAHASDKGGANALRRSFDAEEELDAGLAADLAAVADPERLRKLARSFEMAWRIRKPGRPEPCSSCHGTGEHECNWCHGTGYLTVGDQLICSTSNHSSSCPVCKGTGACKCERCVGTGFRAKWLPAESPLG